MITINNKFIILEGSDGTGKTTICNKIKNTNIKILKCPSSPYSSIKKMVLEKNVPYSRLFYFLASNYAISNLVSQVLTTQHVVCDRYFYSTFAYHAALEKKDISDLIEIINYVEKTIIIPDFIFYLKVDRDIQVKRCKERKDDKLQQGLLLDEEFQKRLEKNYMYFKKKYKTKWIEIDTSEKTIEEINKIILEKSKISPS